MEVHRSLREGRKSTFLRMPAGEINGSFFLPARKYRIEFGDTPREPAPKKVSPHTVPYNNPVSDKRNDVNDPNARFFVRRSRKTMNHSGCPEIKFTFRVNRTSAEKHSQIARKKKKKGK